MNPAYMVAAVIAARRQQPVPEQEVAVQYLCLIYSDETQWPRLSKPEHDRVLGEYLAYTEDVRHSGHLRGGNPLEPTSAATTVRVRNGKVSTTDGPFAETKEQLGGYYLLEARDLNEAIQLAARIPGARYGCIEVRPIAEINA
jgi:hypothetical protein